MSDNPYDQFDAKAPQAKSPPVARHSAQWQNAPLAQDPWAGFQEAPPGRWQDAPLADDKGPWNNYTPAWQSNPVEGDVTTANQPGSLPVITDDGSNWASQHAQRPQANPYDQFDTPQRGNQAKLTPVDHDPFAQFAKAQPTWSSSAFSLLPISQYADGTYDWDSNAGMVGAAKRLGQSVVGAVENLPGLARQVGRETALNTATPQTAGQVGNLAAMTAMGPDVRTITRTSVPAPTSAALHAAADADYETLRNMNVHYEPDAVAAAMQAQQDALSQRGWSSETADKTHRVLGKLANPDPSAISVPLNGLAQARTILGRIGQGADRQDAAAAKDSIRAIDQFIANPSPQSVMAGPAASASDVLQRANGNYAAAMRSDKINGLGDYAQFRTSGANSGANFDNTLRQQVSPLFDPRFTTRRLAGFTEPEKAAISQVSEGSFLRNRLRDASSYMGGGGGGVAALEGLEAARAGNELAGPLGAAVGATVPFMGRGLRAAQNGMARSALNKADELIRGRSPLNQRMQASAPLKATPPTNAGISAAKTLSAQQQPQPDPMGWGVGYNSQYAKGGIVKRPSHEYLVNRLMRLAEEAQREEKKATAPILNMPDDLVTFALRRAQAAL